MTLNLLYWVPEGIVMCADSMLTHTLSTPNGPAVTNFEYAEKLVTLGKQIPAAAMFNGQAFLLDQSVSVILKKVARDLDGTNTKTADDVYDAVKKEVDAVYSAKTPLIKADFAKQWSTPAGLQRVNMDRAQKGLPATNAVDPGRVAFIGDPANSADPKDYDLVVDMTLIVIVASHFDNGPSAKEIIWPGARENDVLATFGKTLVWWGSGGTPVSRLMQGYDVRLLQALAENGGAAAQRAESYMRSEAVRFSMPVPMAILPLQDAIDFVEAMGEVACYYDRFRIGPPTVGGELDIMVLTPDAKEWVGHKEFHSKRRRKERGGNR